MENNFKSIALIGKYNSASVGHDVQRLAEFLAERGHQVWTTLHTADNCQIRNIKTAPLVDLANRMDLAIVLGGDGTLLNVARVLASHPVPMIGVNLGRLGFLADVSLDTMLPTLEEMLAGQYVAEDRIMLECHIERRGELFDTAYAFNDAVVSKGNTGRLIEFEVYIDDKFVYSQRADGLVLATPTGSTAYALSAGGPIMHPTLEAFVLTPVCAHTLSARPIAVNSRSEIEINLIHADDARAHFDGQRHQGMLVGDRLVVRRAKNTIRLLHPAEHNYYDTLREKLHWGEKL
jgi:NAD+ kinase